ncbi:MAG: response regulator [Flavobacteriales bacterium]|nr:response regulator [Flavobacteriales bacterium]MBS4042144.1 response regulator [Flavobacteriales bacterium]
MKQVHLLLIGNNEGDIALMMDAFEKEKIKAKVSIAKNGSEALEYLIHDEGLPKVQVPDLILLNGDMEVFNGLEVLEEIKNRPSLGNIPVILLTGASNQKDIDLAYEDSSTNITVKPIEMEDFISAVFKTREVMTSALKISNLWL